MARRMADEYIRRDDFIQYLEKCKKGAAVTNLVWAAIMAIERDVRDMPAADVAPVVHEKWLLDRWPSWPHRECSRCKIMIPRTKEVPDQYWQYCPNCGARMDGGNEGE